MKEKILICSPTNKVKKYCMHDWLTQVRALSYPNYNIYVSDNSKDLEFSEFINTLGIKCGYVSPYGKTNQEYMSESHEQCREVAIKGKYDYMLHWEVDLFTKNRFIIQNLLSHRKSVVGATYHIGHGADSHLCIINMSKSHFSEKGVSVQMLKKGADLNFVSGGIKPVFSVGLGCILIHKSVFSQIKFRWDKKLLAHPDSFFSEDCFYKGIPIYADTGTLLEHKNSQWLHY